MPNWTECIRPHLAALRLNPGREAEVLEEVSQHLEQRFEELRVEGVSEAEATAMVIEELCDPRSLAEYMRPLRQAQSPAPIAPSNSSNPFRGCWRDLRIAFRSIRKTPSFAATAILTLALAIGSNAAMFSVVEAVLIRPLRFAEADRLVSIRASAPGSDVQGNFGVGPEFYVQYREAKTLQDLALYRTFQTTVRADDHVERLFMAAASYSLYSTLGVEPLIGRLPTRNDEDVDFVLLSHSLWKTWFDSDPSVLGRKVEISGNQWTVIGVMRPEFEFPNNNISGWVNLRIAKTIELASFNLNLIARLAPGADQDSLAAELSALARRLPERFGGNPDYARLMAQHRPVVRSLEDALVGELKRPLWILLGTAGIVLLVACANVANLLITRAERRKRDLAVRLALGARRLTLVRAQLTEALLLAIVAGACGLFLAWAGLRTIVQTGATQLPRLSTAEISGTVLLFTLGVATIAAIAAGLLSALRSTRFEMMGGLRSKQVGEGRNHRMRNILVVVQTSAAFVLLVGSALLFQSFLELRTVDPGFDTKNIFTFQMGLQASAHNVRDAVTAERVHRDFMNRLAALPGVESVGLVNTLPLDEGAPDARFTTDRATGVMLRSTFAGGDYFQTMGIQLLNGKYFAESGNTSGIVEAIVSRTGANLLWPGESPLGKRLRLFNTPDEWLTVVGVVEDVKLENFREEPSPLVYLPMVGPTPRSWIVGTPAYVVKTARAETIAPEIRELVHQFQVPTAPMYRVFTMSNLASRSMAELSFLMFTLAIASGIALVLGTVGLYGTLSYMVSQRTSEIGLRMALGAQVGEVRRMIVSYGGRIALLGVFIGFLAAVLLTRALNSLLFRIAAIDVTTFIVVSVIMLGVALLASYIPARRASLVDPTVSLRAE